MGRCWVARLGTGPEGKTVFQHQPKRLLFNDGFSCDDDKPVVAAAPESVGCTPTERRRQLSRNYDDIRSKRTLYLQRIG